MKTPTPRYRWNKLRNRMKAVASGLGITTREIYNIILTRINDGDYITYQTFFSCLKKESPPKPEIVLAMLELLQIMEASTSREEVAGCSREAEIKLLLQQTIY